MEQYISEALALLEEKRLVFVKYEEITTSMLSEDEIATIEKYITERDVLANQIDEIDKLLCKKLEPLGEDAQTLIGGRAERKTLAVGLLPLYDACDAVMEIVRRVRLKNTEVLQRCSQMRDDNMRKIKSSSNVPKISRYLNGLAEPRGGNNFGSV